MDVPVRDVRLLRSKSSKEHQGPASPPPCPRCNGTGWIKTFTPWGCPVNSACSCTLDGARRRRKPLF